MDKTLKEAYENLVKQNTRLHAEKIQIVTAAEKAIKNAQHEITSLQNMVDQTVSSAIDIVREEMLDSFERKQVIARISALALPKIGESK